MTAAELTAARATVLTAMGLPYSEALRLWYSSEEHKAHDWFGIGLDDIDANFVLGPVVEWLREHEFVLSLYSPGSVMKTDGWWAHVIAHKTYWDGEADTAHDAIMFAAAAALERKDG